MYTFSWDRPLGSSEANGGGFKEEKEALRKVFWRHFNILMNFVLLFGLFRFSFIFSLKLRFQKLLKILKKFLSKKMDFN